MTKRGNAKPTTPVWTVVRHSGYNTGHAEFARGLESASIGTVAQLERVRAAGGLVFDSYTAAEEYAQEEMYRDVEGFSLVPHAPGSFSSDVELDGRAVYVPVVAPPRGLTVGDLLDSLSGYSRDLPVSICPDGTAPLRQIIPSKGPDEGPDGDLVTTRICLWFGTEWINREIEARKRKGLA